VSISVKHWGTSLGSGC